METKELKSPAIRSIRFPGDLYERITQDAKAGYRNFSQQVILLIERGLQELEKPEVPRD